MDVYSVTEYGNKEKICKRAVAVGTFDGLHKGHQKLIEATKETVETSGGELVVLTFWPPPQVLIDDKSKHILLQNRQQKERQLEELGVHSLVTMEFDSELAQLSPLKFVEEILIEKLSADWVYVGFNFTFGAGGKGDVKYLRQLGKELGYRTEVISPVEICGCPVSSTRIRRALSKGDMTLARQLLGRPHAIEGRVISGRGRGSSEVGFPTANVRVSDEIVTPAPGVYAVEVNSHIMPEAIPGVANVGGSPTFGDMVNPPLEVHIIGFSGDLYNEVLSVSFYRFLRKLQSFDSSEALAVQIEDDIQKALMNVSPQAAGNNATG